MEESEANAHGDARSSVPWWGILQKRWWQRPSHLLSVIVVIVVPTITAWVSLGQTLVAGVEAAVAPPRALTSAPAPAPTTTNKPWEAGWGPKRPTYTQEHPADHPVLNLITNNPDLGDERNFARIRLKDPVPGGSVDPNLGKLVAAPIGGTVIVAVAVFNNASDGLGPAGTIHGLYVRLGFSDSGTNLPLQVTLGATNVNEIWDGATVLAPRKAHLSLVSGSEKFETNGGSIKVPDALASAKNQLLGYSTLDGEYPVGPQPNGKYGGSGYLTFELQVVAG